MSTAYARAAESTREAAADGASAARSMIVETRNNQLIYVTLHTRVHMPSRKQERRHTHNERDSQPNLHTNKHPTVTQTQAVPLYYYTGPPLWLQLLSLQPAGANRDRGCYIQNCSVKTNFFSLCAPRPPTHRETEGGT